MSGARNPTDQRLVEAQVCSARKLHIVVDTISSERNSSSLSLRVRKTAVSGSALSNESMIRNWPRKRAHTTCTSGRSARG